MSAPTPTLRAAVKDRRLWRESILLHVLLILLACAVLYILFFSSLGLITKHGDEAAVPSLTGQPVSKAVKTLEDAGFEVQVDSTYEPGKKKLIVLRQIPDPGDMVKTGRILFLTVNKAEPPMTPMPNLINLSFRSATLVLKSNRLILGDTIYRPDIAEGAVLDQLYNGKPIRPGQSVPQGSRISLVLGDGLRGVEMTTPNVIGMPLSEAIDLLNGSGITFTPLNDDPGGSLDSDNLIIYKQYPNSINELGQTNRIKQGDNIEIYYKTNPDPEELDRNQHPERSLNNPDAPPLKDGETTPSAPAVPKMEVRPPQNRSVVLPTRPQTVTAPPSGQQKPAGQKKPPPPNPDEEF